MKKHLSDAKLVLGILNTQFKALLKRFGFDTKGGSIWFATPEKDWNALQTKWNVIYGIASMIPVEDDYIYEEFDIPKPKDYNTLKKEKNQNLKEDDSFFRLSPLD